MCENQQFSSQEALSLGQVVFSLYIRYGNERQAPFHWALLGGFLTEYCQTLDCAWSYQNMFLLRSTTWGPSHKRNKLMCCIGEIVHSWSRLRLNKKEISLNKIWFANWDTNRRTKSMPLQKTVSVNTHLDFFQHNTSSPHILISHQLKLNGGRMIRPLSDEESRWILLFKLTFLAWSRSSSDCFSKNLWNPAKATSSRSKW